MKSFPTVPPGPENGKQLPEVFLKQGEYYISTNDPVVVRAILGSCLAVTMHCPRLQIGGITHSLLPHPLPGTVVPEGQQGRFVDLIIRRLYRELSAMGAKNSDLDVKVFGGGQLLFDPAGNPLEKRLCIGRQNAETALNVLTQLGLQVTATDVGGNWGRKLMFYPHQGDVRVKKIVRRIDHDEGRARVWVTDEDLL